MPNYRRIHATGGTFFFTAVTYERLPIFSNDPSVEILQKVIDKTRSRYPFDQIAFCILPDHLHCIWRLPMGDEDYSTRWQMIKACFSMEYKHVSGLEGHRTDSRISKRERGIWQRRFWEHTIRDDEDLARHINYIHFNPVKHGLVTRIADCRWSSYHEYLRNGYYDEEWGDRIPEDIVELGWIE
jgi:putative transposase